MPGKVGAKGDKGPEGHTVSGICIFEYCKNAKSTVIRENRRLTVYNLLFINLD